MTPSSEEIAAALEFGIAAIEDVVRNGANLGPQFKADEEAAATTLRVHLSRLREEARFRDAALRYGKARRFERTGVLSIDRGPADELVAALSAFEAAFRALEEPRDG